MASTADRADDPLPFVIPLPSLTTFAAMVFVASQVQTIIEFFLRRQLSEFRNTAYQATVASRGKSRDWWGPYVEEWQEPPYAKAEKQGKKAKLYVRLATPIFRIFVLRGACPGRAAQHVGTSLTARFRPHSRTSTARLYPL